MAKADLANVLRALYARVPRGVRLGLGPMQAACARFDSPERAFEAVHVAGTNGKGSTCALVESIARAAGLRTGMYTSPHLCRFAERIRIDGAPITDVALVDVLGDALKNAPDLSFFETSTLAAFAAFREAQIDLAIVEVGLGGRLDATNVIPPPRAAAITRIALDHTDRLGSTVVEIAREKAGIAKAGTNVLLGPAMPPDVRAAIDDVCRTAGAKTTAIDDEAERLQRAVSGLSMHVAPYTRPELAYAIGERIGATHEQCRDGLTRARWPGRCELVRTKDGPVLLDAAHNLDGVEALLAALDRENARSEARGGLPGALLDAPRSLVFGALADKAWREMLTALAPSFPQGRVYVAATTMAGANIGAARAPANPNEIVRVRSGVVAADVREALTIAREQAGSSGLVVVCGSIFLVGEARALLLGLERDPAVAL
jgi:dihydrofolate synthase/folylpolyglutamate synthase